MDELTFLWNMLWKPDKYAKRQLDFGSALKLYYTLAILPFIAYIVFGAIAIAFGYSVHDFGANSAAIAPFYHALASVSYLALLWGGIVLFFIALPLGIAIDALIYQLIAKFFLKAWNGDYSKTFAALVFGLFPMLALLWLSVIPVFSTIFIIIAPIWSIVVLVIALSVQQKITRLNALLLLLLKSFLVFLVMALLGLSVFASMAYVVSSLVPAGTAVVPLSNATTNWTAMPHWNWGGMMGGPWWTT
jgi:hypothetical protein